MGEWRFCYRQPHAIHCPTYRRIDLAFHLFSESLFAGRRFADEIGDLADLCPLRMTQTLAAEFAGETGRLGTFEFDCLEVLHRYIRATAIQPFSGRTDTVAEVFGENKVFCREEAV